MKINVITCPFGDLPPRAVGAVEKLFYQLAGAWASAGHDVCFVCAGGGEDSRLRYVRLGKFKRTGRTLTDLPIDLWYSIKAVLAMPKCDVLVCNTFWSPILAPLVRWKYKKLVYGVHRYPKGQFGLYRFVHSFIAVSTAIGDAVKAQCKSAAPKVRVVCNPIDTAVFCAGASKSDSTIIKIAYTGRVAREKGIVHLARALQTLSQDESLLNGRRLQLVLAGPWESSMGGGGQAYRDEIVKAFPQVEFLGPIYDPQQIAELIRSADIYCYPTIAERGEAMPVAPLEAMACGVPVVLPRFKCFADYAKDGENCVMYDGPDQLVAALKSVLVDPERAWQIAEKGKGSVGPFAVDAVARRYLDAFEEKAGA